jgi:hypothetical protein
VGVPGATNQQGPNDQSAGPDNGEAFEAGEDENGEEFEPMDAGAEAQEAIERSSASAEPSAFAPENSDELRRDDSGQAQAHKPESDDDLQ